MTTFKERQDRLASVIDGLERLPMRDAPADTMPTTRSLDRLPMAHVWELMPVFFADIETGEIVYITRRVEELFGWYIRNSLRGRCIDDLVPPDIRSQHVNFRRMFFDDPRARMSGVRGRPLLGYHKRGHTFPVEIELQAVAIDGHDYVMGLIFDMSQRTNQPPLSGDGANVVVTP